MCALIFVAVLTNFILRVRHRYGPTPSFDSSSLGTLTDPVCVTVEISEELRDIPSPKNPWLTSYALVKSVFVNSDGAPRPSPAVNPSS